VTVTHLLKVPGKQSSLSFELFICIQMPYVSHFTSPNLRFVVSIG